MPFVSAILVAAGRSQRMGFDKLLVELAGRPVLMHSLDRFEQCPAISEIVLVLHPERRDHVRAAIERAGAYAKLRQIVDGGSERHLSVWAGLQAIQDAADLVAVHDAARPLVSSDTIGFAIAAAADAGAVALAVPVVETLKRAGKGNVVTGSVNRQDLWAMQTPQVFRKDWLLAAYQAVLARGEAVTDEVSAVQALGYPVRLLENPDWNLKITFPRDLAVAEGLLRPVQNAIRSARENHYS
ncbi:MAG: 2-C-methyl-D-erythritol 4-phosphate cytidylyltransferase [Verrucomicrobia bacterium]|nr:2-C-methyl-D-erythritol 4-phosphate cytidylyltransferase [Verrucomicrobiota bacterium]